jgi:RNA polymerase sigma-70 factor (ECF subfamily)
MEITDNSLIEAHNLGESDAFEQIVRRYGPALLGYIIKMSGSREKAEDYFQQTFMKVYEKANTFRQGNFKSWLFTIATNVVMDGFRRQKRAPALSLNEMIKTANSDGEEFGAVVIADNTNNPFENAAQAELAEKLRGAIVSLPAGQRTALVLSYYQQMSYSQVAKVLGCSIGTVKKQMYRALKRLADKLPEQRKIL